MSDAGRVRIESMGVYLPRGVLRTEELIGRLRFKPRWDFTALTGIEERRTVADEGVLELASRAAERALAMSRYSAAELDFVIFCSLSRFSSASGAYLEPSIASRVRRAIGASRAQVFDVCNACAGTFTAIEVAQSLMRAGGGRTALLVSGELLTNVTEVAVQTMRSSFDRQFASLTIGDCGSAFLVDLVHTGEVGFHAIKLATESLYHPLGYAIPCRRRPGYVMYTDPIKLHRVAIKALGRLFKEALDESAWTIEQVDWLINHQTSVRALHRARRSYSEHIGAELPRDKVVVNVARYGNTSSTSHALAMHAFIKTGQIRPHQRLVFLISGSGIVSGSACYALDDLPERYLAHLPEEEADA